MLVMNSANDDDDKDTPAPAAAAAAASRLTEASRKAIAARVRAALRTARRNGLDTTHDLAMELAAHKLVVATLTEQALLAGVGTDVLCIADDLADDLTTTITALGIGDATSAAATRRRRWRR